MLTYAVVQEDDSIRQHTPAYASIRRSVLNAAAAEEDEQPEFQDALSEHDCGTQYSVHLLYFTVRTTQFTCLLKTSILNSKTLFRSSTAVLST
jgi:hypothetical protein